MTSIVDVEGRLPFTFSTDAAGAFQLLGGDASLFNRLPELSTAPDDLLDADVKSEGISVARLRRESPRSPWFVAFVACIDSVHGVHPRWREASERLRDLRRRLHLSPPPATCARCDGSGWLELGSVEATKQRALARSFGMWRGIVCPDPPPVTREDAFLAMEAVLFSTGAAQTSGAAVGAEGEAKDGNQD
jgi:hypothetical protein